MNAAVHTLSLGQLSPSSMQTQTMRRKAFNKDALQELASSVRTHGILQPIVVRPRLTTKGTPAVILGEYEIVAGERRFLAARMAELAEVPVSVRELTDEQVIEIQLIENLQREDVHPMLEAEGYHELMHKYGHAIEDIYAKIGKSRSYVYGRMKLLALSKDARKAFYDGDFSASIALIVARIPDDELQTEAVQLIRDERMSFREAAAYVKEHFMLRLADAPFPLDDATLVAAAGACQTCPKRTGNAPELFSDIKGPDVCTDVACFQSKTLAHSKVLIAKAIETGQEVITGDAAKKVARYGFDGNSFEGYQRLDKDEYIAGKWKRVSAIVGKDAPVSLLHDDKTGKVIRVVKSSFVEAAIAKSTGTKPQKADPYRAKQLAQEKKAKLETKFRHALYAAIRPKLPTPSLEAIARAIFDRLEQDLRQQLCKVRGFEVPEKKTSYGSTQKDYDAIAETLDKLSDAERGLFILDCYHVGELRAHSYGGHEPKRLLAAAKACKVDLAKIRRDLAPKKKPKAKKKAGGRKR